MEATVDKREKRWTALAAFLLPCVLLLAVFAAIGIYPFGEKSLLIIDMDNEYVDYLVQMNRAVREGGSLLRSWNMGMGLNMLGLIAFYTASPFNLLVLLFPAGWITEVLLAITVVKIGLAGLCFSLFTSYALGRSGRFAVVFSVCYALCGYNIAYASNIMWLDGAAMLPLVLLGTEKILRENKYTTFLFGLVYVFLSSYYIGYMIGAFSLLFFTARWLSVERPWGEYLHKLLRLVGTAALAAGYCTFLLLPAFYNLRHGQSEMWSVGASPALQRPFVRVASRLLPGVYDSLTDVGYPNIYSTVLAALLCIAYFTNRGIARRERLVFAGLMGVLFVSFSSGLLDLAWHAFEDPTWFPSRYSFVFSFLVTYLAMRAAASIHSLPAAGAVGALSIFLLLLAEISAENYRNVQAANLLAAITLAVVYAWIGWLLVKRHRAWASSLLLLIVCAEAWANALVMERGLDDQFHYKTRDSYMAYRESYGAAVDTVRRADGGVYRMEIVQQRNANGGMTLGYRGISHYSTTTDQALNRFLRQLGYNRGTENELRFAATTPLTNGLLAIKYILSEDDMGAGYTKLGEVGEIAAYENTCAFPLAFWTAGDATGFSTDTGNPFDLQNQWMRALGMDEDFFSPLAGIDIRLHNADREQKGGYLLYTPRVPSEQAAVEYLVHNPRQDLAYGFFPVWNQRFSHAELAVNGTVVQQDLRYRKNTLVSMGTGENTALSLQIGQTGARVTGEYFYALNLGAAQQAAQVAQRNAVRFTRFTDTVVEGMLLAPKDGVLATTIPADAGWRVYVDSKRASTLQAGPFLALPMPEGEHVLVFKYTPPGFRSGCAVTIACLLGTFIWRFIARFIQNNDPKTQKRSSL